jgi:hypothetical protein
VQGSVNFLSWSMTRFSPLSSWPAFAKLKDSVITVSSSSYNLQLTSFIKRRKFQPVHLSHRGSGLGKQLVYELESFAQRKGIKTIFLLTITARDFFRKLGYEVTHRAYVPASIAETEEFKSICPVSAVCLFKNLKPT